MISNNIIGNEFNEKLRMFFTKSFFLHVAIILFFVLASFVINYTIEKTKRASLKIIESSVRVDMVAMPELTIKELKTMGLPQVGRKVDKTPVVVDKTPVKKNDFLKVKKKKNFLSLMKDMAKKKVNTKKYKKKKTKNKTKQGQIDGIERGDLKKLLLQGNKLSQGTGIVGNGVAATDAFSLYLGRLPMIVKPHWILPSYLIDKDLKCRIRIYLGENGKLLRSNIFETSGNKEYDKKALLAVKKAAPFPELADNIKKRGIDGDIVLGFPL
jgi:colicin import membrane protein